MEKTGLVTAALVSVCIPAYNCEKYVGEAIQSVLAQTYPAIEIIVVDDGSTDNTLNEIRKIENGQVKSITTPNKGAAAARNLAYQNSTGEYIIFFDADDVLPPNFIAQQIKRINLRQDVIVLSGWGRFYNDDLSTFTKEEIPYQEISLTDWVNTYWYRGDPMTAPGRSLIPRPLLNQAGLWNEELSLNDDMDFYTRLFVKAKTILICNDALLHYRSGINGLSSHKSNKAYRSLLQSISLSIGYVLQAVSNDDKIRQSCANMLQGVIYELYPRHAELIGKAQKQIDGLAKPDLKFMAGGITKAMTAIFGWKLTKWIKLVLKVN